MKLIGTSGFVYAKWVGEFYPLDLPKSKFFDYYANKFNSLELNSTFYKIPKSSTLKNWKYKLKKHDMKISVKANKIITHVYKLKNTEILEDFVNLITANLKETLYALLFQLPPSLKKDASTLKNFCSKLKEYDIRFAIEFRNESWNDEEIFDILKRNNVALVWHDYNQKLFKTKTADFIYVRLHGFKGKYIGSYPDYFLKEFCDYENAAIYFNNTDDVSAPKDALKLMSLCRVEK